VVPLIATALGGFWAARGEAAAQMARVIGAAAVTFALVLSLLAWLGEARLGAGLIGRGLARVDVHPLWTFLVALLWAAVGGAAGGLVRTRLWKERS
jgi:hypothetical protein